MVGADMATPLSDNKEAFRMTTIELGPKADFHAVLAASGRSPEIPESADAYGWLIGSWVVEVIHYWNDVAARHIKGEVHFGCVLEGRAVEDVWIVPARMERTADQVHASNLYGTTLHV